MPVTGIDNPLEGTGGIKPAPQIQVDPPQPTVGENIRAGLPEVDTLIDPSKFASQSGVAVADTNKSNVTSIEPPTDIDAANIGEYKPYEAVSGSLDDESTVQGRLTGLLSQNSDYIERARTGADQTANRRGMLNSSMAAGAAEGAAIDRALPIAQQDAAAFKEQQFINQGYSNDAARYLAEQSVQRENLQSGLEQDTRQFNAGQNFEASQLNQAAENRSSESYAGAQNAAATAAAHEANKNNFATLSADLQGQLAGIDNELAANLEQLSNEYSILQNLDSINGSIYQQLVAEIGTILANEDKVGTAQAKINNLIASAGVEFEFSSGTSIGSGGGGGGGPSLLDVESGGKPPTPTTSAGGRGDGSGGPSGPGSQGGSSSSGGSGAGPHR